MPVTLQRVTLPTPKPVVAPGAFVFAAMHLEHAHITGMCDALITAGATLKAVYDPDSKKAAAFCKQFPQARPVSSEADILGDPEIRLVAAAHIPSERCALGMRVMRAGKDYFTDKAPLTTLEQLDQARACVRETGRKYMCYYAERLHNATALLAERFIREGAIGQVLFMNAFGPHRLNAPTRPAWFFRREQAGSILCDIGSHQMEMFLQLAGEEDAQLIMSRVANYAHPEYPEFEDFGECALIGGKGASFHFRVDWFTPDGLRTWGDSRTFITGTEGMLELRKTVDPAVPDMAENTLILVDGEGEKRYAIQDGPVEYPFFGQLILDCLNRTENAMTQEHCFKAAELGVRAGMCPIRIPSRQGGQPHAL